MNHRPNKLMGCFS